MNLRYFVFTMRSLVVIGDEHVKIFCTNSCCNCKRMLHILKIKREIFILIGAVPLGYTIFTKRF